MVRLTEYFAKSPKVTQGHSKWHPWVGHGNFITRMLFYQVYWHYSVYFLLCVFLFYCVIVTAFWQFLLINGYGWIWMCKSLLVLHYNYVSISYCFWDIPHQIMAWLEIRVRGVQGHWKWYRSETCTVSCWHSTVTVAISCIISEIKRDNA